MVLGTEICLHHDDVSFQACVTQTELGLWLQESGLCSPAPAWVGLLPVCSAPLDCGAHPLQELGSVKRLSCSRIRIQTSVISYCGAPTGFLVRGPSCGHGQKVTHQKSVMKVLHQLPLLFWKQFVVFSLLVPAAGDSFGPKVVLHFFMSNSVVRFSVPPNWQPLSEVLSGLSFVVRCILNH